MDERAWLARFLAIGVMLVGGLEWLLGRVVSRLAAAPPIEGIARTIIETLGRIGFFLLSTAFLLAVALLVISALQFGERAYHWRRVSDLALAIYLSVFAIFALAYTLLTLLVLSGDQDWLNVTFNLFSAIAIWWLAIRFIVRPVSWAARASVLLLALAYTGWYWAILLSIRGVPGTGTLLDNPVDALQFGELAAVLVPIALFLAIALPGTGWRSTRRWIAPLTVALLFSAGNIADIIANQGFTGVFSIWSVGFTLYLPWPLYAISLALYLYTLLTCFARSANGHFPFGDANVGLGMLLLPFAGYYLQLTYQHLLALLAMLLFTRIARPLSVAHHPRRKVELVEPATT